MDLDEMKEDTPALFKDCGIDFVRMEQELKEQNGTFLGYVSREWGEKAAELYRQITKQCCKLETLRFLALELLFLIRQGNVRRLEKMLYLTRGQKNIAVMKVRPSLAFPSESKWE